MIETALVFDREGKTLHWHEPPGRSGGSLPDSPDLWSVLWGNREILGGVAHTHPWDGPAHPSSTDVTTFRAVELGLGRLLLWPVVTFTDVKYLVYNQATDQYVPDHSYLLLNYGFPFGLTEWKLEELEQLRERSR